MTSVDPATERALGVDYAAWRARYLAETSSNIAEQLRELASKVDRVWVQLANVGEDGGWRTYARAVAEIQHEVLWGVANLHLDQLTTLAQEADEAAAKVVTAPDDLRARLTVLRDEIATRLDDENRDRQMIAEHALNVLTDLLGKEAS